MTHDGGSPVSGGGAASGLPPGDPRGFAPREAAEHVRGAQTTLFDGTVIVDHRFTVPVDHADTLEQARAKDASATGLGPGGAGTLRVVAREVRGPAAGSADLPWLLYLQGGPGSGAARPARLGGWLKEAAGRFRVLLLDQRGTGASTPATVASLAGMSPEAQAAYLGHLRAPSIVADAEMVRLALGANAWATLGQSFGGFCTLSYLSWFPEGLARCHVTGGLAPLTGPADRVYRATYARMRERNREFFDRHPHAWVAWERVVAHLRAREAAGTPERLPDGTALTVARAQMLGMLLGGNTRVDSLLYVLTEAFDEGARQARLSEGFRAAVAAQADRAQTPLYTLLHEAIYAQPGAAPTDWSAARVLQEHPDFDPGAWGGDAAAPEGTPLLTGEHVFAWQLEAGAPLHPLAEAAQLIAAREDWGALYDLGALAANRVPVAAAVYTHDVYVDRDLSLETAARVRGLRVWETDAFHHDGLADDGAAVLARLLEMTEAPGPIG